MKRVNEGEDKRAMKSVRFVKLASALLDDYDDRRFHPQKLLASDLLSCEPTKWT